MVVILVAEPALLVMAIYSCNLATGNLKNALFCAQVEPDELWEEFFEFVENVPSYDEIINYDVWQEFLLEKYNC